ncbi:MAG: lysophospholipid acyltransferase family protein [Cryomorphaceae bacterium]
MSPDGSGAITRSDSFGGCDSHTPLRSIKPYLRTMLSMLLYYLVILPISYLPFSLLYRLSDVLYVVLYGVFKYRRAVVAMNLERSFPEKNKNELLDIERKFYRHLCDLVVEGLKGFNTSYSQVKERMKIMNPEVIDRYFEQGKSVVIVGGHYGNWEMFALAIDKRIKHKAVALYTPLQDKYIDNKVRASRSKYGLFMLSIAEIRENLASSKDQLTATIFGSDQAPSKKQRAYWMTFLHQETPVQFGTEKFAKAYDMPVVYGIIQKVKRGHFEFTFKDITATPNSTEYGWITQTHTKMLEETIQKQPEYWLWSHKRWKRTRPEGEELHEPLDAKDQ